MPTNSSPIGLPEAVLDYAQYGKVSVDWLGFAGGAFEAMNAAARSKTDYSHPPAKANPAQAFSAYTGTYANSYYGPMTVATPGTSAGREGAGEITRGPR